ncbi:tigger transposable element-derived protein [Plakobranchus ocellatus]|uniref:Tigger transposable element-derived protein n=1 Tax=Plakobranchus ocellatus TaxID=259542 RepID=A0AAV3Z7Z9_9GAST|nr:tigger transposable element-derived protein [Plakobranchus ocellatus]
MLPNPELSLRVSEVTILARALAFNRPNIAALFKLLNETMTKTKTTAFSIFNLDESGYNERLSVPKEEQVILSLHNHRSHQLEFVRENFVHIFTLPYTSNKTQSLDKTVFGPLKSFFKVAANSFMLQHPEKNITIYNMAALVNEAWLKVANLENITPGFRVSGIWPVNKDTDYLPAAVTDQPLHEPPVTDQPLREPPVTYQPLCKPKNDVIDEQIH